jgi:hypothetical protein
MLPHPDHGEIQGPGECGEAASVLACFPCRGMEATSARENDKSILVKMERMRSLFRFRHATPDVGGTGIGDLGDWGWILCDPNGAGSQGHMPHGWRMGPRGF